MEFQRRDRLVELMREEIALALRKVKDPRLSGFLTLTEVVLSKDAKTLTIYYSVMGSETDRLSTAKALESAAPFVHHQLRTRLHIKVIPSVKFEYDKTPERAGRVLELLTKIEQEKEIEGKKDEPADA